MTPSATSPSPLIEDGVRDFSGGANLRDAPSQLALNEASDSWNITFDERGGASSRLGRAKYNSSVYGGGLVQNIYVSTVANAVITQAGDKLYKGTSTTANKTFTTSARVGLKDFAGVLYAIHPVDGMFSTTDGVTWTILADADHPKGDTLEVWQNKLWAAGNTTNKARVFWSNAGDGLVWTATDFVDLRTKDNEQVVALHVASGIDVLGRAGLLAFKQESAYRIYDSTTGAFETVDATQGAASALAVVGVGPKVFALNKHGLFWWENGQVGLQNASDQLQPLWDPSQIALSQLAKFCIGRKADRVRVSLCRFGSTANDVSLEYHPGLNWLAPRSDAVSVYATSTGGEETFYGGSPSVSGQSYILDSTGADDGVAIPWRIQTRWFELNRGFLASLWQIRIHGRGTGTMTIRRDYATAGGDVLNFDLTGSAAFYDGSDFYDAGEVYDGDVRHQNTQALFNIGLCRQISMIFSGSSTATGTGRQVLGVGTAPSVGFFGLYGIEWLYSQLGLA